LRVQHWDGELATLGPANPKFGIDAAEIRTRAERRLGQRIRIFAFHKCQLGESQQASVN
jgi:hypothetical protein